jgi:flagellar basal-body rod modification protein FlgD
MRAANNDNLFNQPDMQKLTKRVVKEKTWIEAQEEKGRKEKINFVNLLATQLKNQLPTDPVDVNQMTQQIVSMNIFEQHLETNKLLNISNRQGEFAYKQAILNLLDGNKEVKVDGNLLSLNENGADINYELASESKNTTISIFDSKNQKVAELTGEKTAGLHKLHWDGIDAYGGKVPFGTYSVIIQAMSPDDKVVTARTFTRGQIEGASFGKNQDEAYVEVNGLNLPLNQITQVWTKPNNETISPLTKEGILKDGKLRETATNALEEIINPIS